MRAETKVRNYYFLYCTFALLLLLVFAKFTYDFYLMNSKITSSIKFRVVQQDKLVLNPRVQIEDDGFTYIEANKGYYEDDVYVFEDVKMKGKFGNITSGKLEIKDDKNILEFTDKPKFIIYTKE